MKKVLLVLPVTIIVAAAIVGGTAHGQAPPPPPPPGGGPTATPLPTNTPQPSPTPIPLTLRVSLGHSNVAAGHSQKVSVKTLGGAVVSVTVAYPNRAHDSVSGAATRSGTLVDTFLQPGGVTTKKGRTVKVTVKASVPGQSKSSVKLYKIG